MQKDNDKEEEQIPGYLKEITKDWNEQGIKNFDQEYKQKQLTVKQMNQFYECKGDPEKLLTWHKDNTPWIKDFSILRNIMISYKLEYDQLNQHLKQNKVIKERLQQLIDKIGEGNITERKGLCECSFVRIKTQTPEGSNLFESYCTCEGRQREDLKLQTLIDLINKL